MTNNLKYYPKIIIMLLLVPSFITLLLIKNNSAKISKYNTYITNKFPLSFEYPQGWEVKQVSEETEIAQQIKIIDPKGFFIYIRSEKIGACLSGVPCQAGQPHIYFPFRKSDFEQVGTIEEKELYVSVKGKEEGEFIQEQEKREYTYIGKDLSVNSMSYVLERKDNSLAEELSILGHEGERDSLLIYYGFDNEQAIKKWSEYKEILKHIINSMQSK